MDNEHAALLATLVAPQHTAVLVVDVQPMFTGDAAVPAASRGAAAPPTVPRRHPRAQACAASSSDIGHPAGALDRGLRAGRQGSDRVKAALSLPIPR